tara:strand:- start:89 stop:304 length:216 start_codon:yes stop_codon:yes gene_type:complete
MLRLLTFLAVLSTGLAVSDVLMHKEMRSTDERLTALESKLDKVMEATSSDVEALSAKYEECGACVRQDARA